MEHQRLLMQLQRVASPISQHNGYHNKQIPQTSLPSMGSVQGNPQDICVAQRQPEGEKQREQQQRSLKMLMEQQKLLMQLQQVDSTNSQHNGCHNKQIPQVYQVWGQECSPPLHLSSSIYLGLK